uniref:Uncharacterized protein n=1 Tax=Meloidogyne enterolobii TaxID=390850 RepID=A0A6V7UDD7_MELEN|nr:unnamed protein product [Meloidogyne enterolobii]
MKISIHIYNETPTPMIFSTIMPTMCDTLAMVQPEIKQETLTTSNIFNLLTVACYVTIWILMAFRKEYSSINRRLVKSLTAIILINLLGYVNVSLQIFAKGWASKFCGK